MRLRLLIISGMAILSAFPTGCSTVPVPSEFGEAALARSSPSIPDSLNCKEPRSIRDFKDFVMGGAGLDSGEVERWIVCLCGNAARALGDAHQPASMLSVSPYPAYDADNPAQSLAQMRAWSKSNLPISDTQAARLAECLYGNQ